MSIFPVPNPTHISLRCLNSQSMENLSVAYDMTVRDAQNQVICFKYGSDGFNSERLQHVRLSHAPPCRSEIPYGWDADEILLVEDEIAFIESVPMPFEYVSPVDIAKWIDIYDQPHISNTLLPSDIQEEVETLFLEDNEKWNTYVRMMCSTRQMRTKIDESMFTSFIGEVRRRLDRAFVQPGEMVGCLAAQVVAEPCTQECT